MWSVYLCLSVFFSVVCLFFTCNFAIILLKGMSLHSFTRVLFFSWKTGSVLTGLSSEEKTFPPVLYQKAKLKEVSELLLKTPVQWRNKTHLHRHYSWLVNTTLYNTEKYWFKSVIYPFTLIWDLSDSFETVHICFLVDKKLKTIIWSFKVIITNLQNNFLKQLGWLCLCTFISQPLFQFIYLDCQCVFL